MSREQLDELAEVLNSLESFYNGLDYTFGAEPVKDALQDLQEFYQTEFDRYDNGQYRE